MKAMAGSSHSSRKSRWENPNSISAKKPISSAAAAAKPPQSKPSSNPNPSPKPTPKSNPNPNPSPIHPKPTSNPTRPELGRTPIGPPPPPPPSYGFHMLERRSIPLADGSVRSYFALPPDYDFAPRHHPGPEFPGPGSQFPPLGPMSPEMGDRYMGKRKLGDEREFRRDERELDLRRRHLLHLGNMNPNGYPHGAFLAGPSNSRELMGFGGNEEIRMGKQMRLGGDYQGNSGINKYNEVDQSALKKAFLQFVKLINENANLKKVYLENGRQGPLNCVICGSFVRFGSEVSTSDIGSLEQLSANGLSRVRVFWKLARDFPDMHSLIMHTHNPDRADQLVDHLGFHKALCILMGWSYSIAPDNSKKYQILSADEAAANQDDVILWPPMVIVHNTITGKGKEGRMEGLGNKAMDAKLRELGFASGKAKSVYGKEGHMGITLVKFSADQSGLKEAVRLAEFLEREKRGRNGWARVQPSLTMGKEDEKNHNLMELDKNGEKQRIFYGYLGTVFDLDKLDFETRKKIQVDTRRDYGATN